MPTGARENLRRFSMIAVAGVGGVAIGFGAQTLVKDVISGIFLWVEGNITVGDIVEVNGLSGEVEAIAIRTTTIRHFSGNLYVIPNGDIRTVTNMMQPIVTSGAVANPNSSAPSSAAMATSRPVISLPSVSTITRLRRLLSINV